MTLPASAFTTGTKIRGIYMGSPFTGTVAGIESDASGYADMRNAQRISIRTDAPIVAPRWIAECGTVVESFVRRQAGESIILHVEKVAGGLVRRDDRYTDLRIAKVAA